MATYSYKIIQGLKPQWYMDLSKKQKLAAQKDIKERHKEGKQTPPACIQGKTLVAKENTTSVTKGRKYKVMGHFCTLNTTVYSTNWRQFVTLKNDYGHTVKMNLDNFDLT